VASSKAASRERVYLFFFRNLTPGTSPLVNSMPAASSAALIAAKARRSVERMIQLKN